MTDRNEWITKRNEWGFNWGPMMEAMSKIVARRDGDGLVLDWSPIEPDEYAPHSAFLTPDDDGMWWHAESGECGPLFEWFCTFALSALDRGNTTPEQQET